MLPRRIRLCSFGLFEIVAPDTFIHHSVTGGIGNLFQNFNSLDYQGQEESKSCFDKSSPLVLDGFYSVAIDTSNIQLLGNHLNYRDYFNLSIDVSLFEDGDKLQIGSNNRVLDSQMNTLENANRNSISYEDFVFTCRANKVAIVYVQMDTINYRPYQNFRYFLRQRNYHLGFYIKDIHESDCHVQTDLSSSQSLNDFIRLDTSSCHEKNHLVIEKVPFCQTWWRRYKHKTYHQKRLQKVMD